MQLEGRLLALTLLLIQCVVLMLSSVFSAQYVIWLVPLLLAMIGESAALVLSGTALAIPCAFHGGLARLGSAGNHDFRVGCAERRASAAYRAGLARVQRSHG
jgi:hypothetical protein